MTEIVLSEEDRVAVVFKKLIDPESKKFEYRHLRHLDHLSKEQIQLMFLVMAEGEDYTKREKCFYRECIARGWDDLIRRVEIANSALDLDQVTFEDPWSFEGYDKIYEELPPQEWLVYGKIPKPGLTMVYGAPKSFKSGLIMDLAVCVATGSDWLPNMENGDGGYRTQKTPVIWCDFENGLRRMRERFAAFGRARELPEDTPLWFVSLPNPILEANRKEQIGDLVRRVRLFEAGCIVIDHFGATLGSADENTSQVAEVMTNYRILSEETNATVILVHHQIKHANKYGFTSGDTLRGHGSILANLDLAMLVKRDDMSKDKVSINPVAIRGADFDILGGMWTYEHKQSSKELQAAKFLGWTIEDTNTQVDNAIIETIKDDPGLNQTALRSIACDITGIGDVTIRKRIAYLEKEGEIVSRDGEKNSKLYNLP